MFKGDLDIVVTELISYVLLITRTKTKEILSVGLFFVLRQVNYKESTLTSQYLQQWITSETTIDGNLTSIFAGLMS